LRIAFACLVIAAPLACAQAGEISSDHRGTWTESGDCQQARRIVIGEKTITLVDAGRARTLTDGDEAVFKGVTLINASLPAKKEEDPVLAFSAKLVEQDGDVTLVTEGLEDGGGFSGTFKRCKPAATATHTASRDKPRAAARKTAVTRTTRQAPYPAYAYPAGTLLGGLY
jgi:hypothetical protein